MLIVAGLGSSRWSATSTLSGFGNRTPSPSTAQLRYARELISQRQSTERYILGSLTRIHRSGAI